MSAAEKPITFQDLEGEIYDIANIATLLSAAVQEMLSSPAEGEGFQPLSEAEGDALVYAVSRLEVKANALRARYLKAYEGRPAMTGGNDRGIGAGLASIIAI